MPSTVIGLTANIKSKTAVERMICRWEIDSSVPQPKPKLCSKFKTNMCHRRRIAKIRPIHVLHPCAFWGPAIGRGGVVWNQVHATEVRGAWLIPANLTWKKIPSWPWVWWWVAVRSGWSGPISRCTRGFWWLFLGLPAHRLAMANVQSFRRRLKKGF